MALRGTRYRLYIVILLSSSPTTMALRGTRYRLYIVPRTCSGTTSDFNTPTDGKYTPTQNSKSKNADRDSRRCPSLSRAATDAKTKDMKPVAQQTTSLIEGFAIAL